MTYSLFPVGIISTLEITENLGAEFAATAAHFVSSARAVVALSIISSSVKAPFSSSMQSKRLFSSSGSELHFIILSI